MIGSYCIMRAKKTVEATNICVKKVGTLFNLKTKRLDMGGAKIAVNKINLIERGNRHLHVLSGIVKMYRVGFNFSIEETGKGRRGFDIVHAFIKGNVLGSLDLAGLEIFMVCMSHDLLVYQKDPRARMHINFGISRFSRKGIDVTTEHTKERDWVHG